MQNGWYDVNRRIKKVMDENSIKQKILCIYCFLVARKKLLGQPNTCLLRSFVNRKSTKKILTILPSFAFSSFPFTFF